ncbi:hypothetical protein C7M84_017197 [Penaeus vannamei]|uniref:Uncharacterized protein n=1 Tax=Penaeus vannamei TaxID=6689 RepID=A0A423SKU4_PENVA|nr:hypothetical protein C7M84_017197 [Penaeus vannamei]
MERTWSNFMRLRKCVTHLKHLAMLHPLQTLLWQPYLQVPWKRFLSNICLITEYAAYHNRNLRPPWSLEAGSLVLYKIKTTQTGPDRALGPRWQGPAKVVKKLSPPFSERNCHANQLRPFKLEEELTFPDASPYHDPDYVDPWLPDDAEPDHSNTSTSCGLSSETDVARTTNSARPYLELPECPGPPLLYLSTVRVPLDLSAQHSQQPPFDVMAASLRSAHARRPVGLAREAFTSGSGAGCAKRGTSGSGAGCATRGTSGAARGNRGTSGSGAGARVRADTPSGAGCATVVRGSGAGATRYERERGNLRGAGCATYGTNGSGARQIGSGSAIRGGLLEGKNCIPFRCLGFVGLQDRRVEVSTRTSAAGSSREKILRDVKASIGSPSSTPTDIISQPKPSDFPSTSYIRTRVFVGADVNPQIRKPGYKTTAFTGVSIPHSGPFSHEFAI